MINLNLELARKRGELSMPTYEYKCKQCGVFEKFQGITEAPIKECPTCGQSVKRIISKNVNIIYKTGGFYCTDNRGEDYNSAKSKETDNSGGKAS